MMKMNKNSLLTKLAFALLASILLSSISTTNAASDWDDNNNGNDYITVYQHCGYQGGSKRLSTGEYKRVQDEGIPNDEISSMRIPQGMSVKVYKHKKFKGKSETFNSSVSCLTRELNDQITSLKVRRARGTVDSGGDWGGSGGNQCVSYNVSASGGEGGFRFTHDPSSFQRIGGRAITGRICNRDTVQVELSKTNRATRVVLDINGDRYRFDQGDAGDRHENNWYRKYYNVRVN